MGEITDSVVKMNACNGHLFVFVVFVHVLDGFHQVIYMKLKVEKRGMIYCIFPDKTAIQVKCTPFQLI